MAPGPWSRELVVHAVRHEQELAVIAESGVTIHRLKDIVKDLKSGRLPIQGAAGSHLLDLVALGAE